MTQHLFFCFHSFRLKLITSPLVNSSLSQLSIPDHSGPYSCTQIMPWSKLAFVFAWSAVAKYQKHASCASDPRWQSRISVSIGAFSVVIFTAESLGFERTLRADHRNPATSGNSHARRTQRSVNILDFSCPAGYSQIHS